MMTGKMILYDLKQGFRYNRKKWILVFCVNVILLLMFLNLEKSMADFGMIAHSEVHFMDVLYYFFRGDIPMKSEISSEEFRIPAIWILLHFELHFLLSAYPLEDIYSYGQQIFIRTSRREIWWSSKCVWCLSTVFLFYGLLYLMTLAVCLLKGFSLELQLNSFLMENLYLVDPELAALSEPKLLVILILLQVLVSCALGIWQLAFSLLIGSMGSMITVLAYLQLSAFYNSPLLFGAYSMAIRSNLLAIPGIPHLDSIQGIYITIAAAACAFFLGRKRMKYYELLPSGI